MSYYPNSVQNVSQTALNGAYESLMRTAAEHMGEVKDAMEAHRYSFLRSRHPYPHQSVLRNLTLAMENYEAALKLKGEWTRPASRTADLPPSINQSAESWWAQFKQWLGM